MSFLLPTLILSLHLVCMNVATAGPLVCVWLDWRERRGDALAGWAGRALALWSLGLFLIGMLLGVLLAWQTWTPAFWRDLLERLPGRIYWGAWELAFSALLLAAYWAWWKFALGGAAARSGRSLLALLTATNLMYHFPPLFVAIALFSAGELPEHVTLDDESFRRVIWRGEVFALTVHFWMASLAAAGALLALLALRPPARLAAEPAAAARLATAGGRIALVPTLLQIPIGLWVMTSLPTLRQNRLMGDDLAATALLGLGVLGAFWLLHCLAALAMGDARRKTIVLSAVLMLAVIVLMTAALRYSRPEEKSGSTAETSRTEALVNGVLRRKRCEGASWRSLRLTNEQALRPAVSDCAVPPAILYLGGARVALVGADCMEAIHDGRELSSNCHGFLPEPPTHGSAAV